MGSMFIPKYGDIRNANDYRLQNTIFADNGKLFKYVKVAVGTYIRKYSPLFVNSEGEAIIPKNARILHNAVAEFDIDAMGEDKWARVIWQGDANVDVVGKETSCVYHNTKLVGWFNGLMRSVNGNALIATLTTRYGALTCVMALTGAASTNASALASRGDVITTNSTVEAYAIIAGFPNASSIVTTQIGPVAQSNTESLVYCTDAIGTALRSTIAATSANYVDYKIAVPANAVNICTAATVFTLNAAVAGMLVKAGDRIKFSGVGMLAGADSCTLYVTDIINATAFHCNASTDVDTTGAMGTIFNVCANYFKCTVGSF